MPDPNLQALTPGALFHDRYRVVRCIKAGGMGAVYEVFDERTGSHRALKVMLPELVQQDDLRRRFEREARITGSILSDHLVLVLDSGVDGPTAMPFLAMELLHGDDTASLLKQRGGLPPREVALYLSQAGLALDKVHAAGIVHRDLKPENLFISRRDDGSPCLKILDFGVAKIVDQQRAVSDKTRAMGTPIYMAPEQVRGEGGLGPAVDLYALGQVAYTLLVGEPYWVEEAVEADSVYAFMARLQQGASELPTVRARRRRQVALPAAFDAWFFHATAIDPPYRFATASAAVASLAEALRVQLSSTPALLLAAPPGAAAAPGEPAAQANSTAALTTSAPPPRRRSSALVLLSLGVFALAGAGAALAVARRAPMSSTQAPAGASARADAPHEATAAAPAVAARASDAAVEAPSVAATASDAAAKGSSAAAQASAAAKAPAAAAGAPLHAGTSPRPSSGAAASAAKPKGTPPPSRFPGIY